MNGYQTTTGASARDFPNPSACQWETEKKKQTNKSNINIQTRHTHEPCWYFLHKHLHGNRYNRSVSFPFSAFISIIFIMHHDGEKKKHQKNNVRIESYYFYFSIYQYYIYIFTMYYDGKKKKTNIKGAGALPHGPPPAARCSRRLRVWTATAANSRSGACYAPAHRSLRMCTSPAL